MPNTIEPVTKTKKLNIKTVAISVVSIVLLSAIVAFLTFTTTGRAIAFAVQDPQTVNHAAEMKADYVKQFNLTTENSPKGN